MLEVWGRIRLTERAEAELRPHAFEIASLALSSDTMVPFLHNIIAMQLEGQDVADFRPGYRCGFIQAHKLQQEVWIRVDEDCFVALRPDEFMSRDVAYLIDYSEGVFLIGEMA